MLLTILTDAKDNLNNIAENFKKEIAQARVGKAAPSLIEDLKTEAYGTQLSVKELGTISVPDPQLLVVSPWDKEVKDSIVTAIRSADLGLNPVIDGEVIKVPVPRLSQERRLEMVKKVKLLAEEAKVKARQIRQDKIKSAEDLENESKISKDDLFRFKEELQSEIQKANQTIIDLSKKKQEELMQVG